MVFKLLFFSLSPASNHCSELFLLQLFSAILSKLVHSVVELSALPFEVCIFYGIDIDYDEFLIFSSLSLSLSLSLFVFVLAFRVFRIHLFSSVFWFSWSIALRLG